MLSVGLVVEEELSVAPFCIVAATDMDSEAEGIGFDRLSHRALSLLHLHLHGIGDLGIDGEELADLRTVFQEEVVPTGKPSADDDMTMTEHLAL